MRAFIRSPRLALLSIVLEVVVICFLAACDDKKPTKVVAAKDTLQVTAPVKEKQVDQRVLNQQAEARADLKQGRAKYYYFSIAYPTRAYIDSMRKHYHVDVVSLGCTPDPAHTAYNKVVDSFIRERNLRRDTMR